MSARKGIVDVFFRIVIAAIVIIYGGGYIGDLLRNNEANRDAKRAEKHAKHGDPESWKYEFLVNGKPLYLARLIYVGPECLAIQLQKKYEKIKEVVVITPDGENVDILIKAMLEEIKKNPAFPKPQFQEKSIINGKGRWRLIDYNGKLKTSGQITLTTFEANYGVYRGEVENSDGKMGTWELKPKNPIPSYRHTFKKQPVPSTNNPPKPGEQVAIVEVYEGNWTNPQWESPRALFKDSLKLPEKAKVEIVRDSNIIARGVVGGYAGLGYRYIEITELNQQKPVQPGDKVILMK